MDPNNAEDNARFRNMVVINQDLIKDIITSDSVISTLINNVGILMLNHIEREKRRKIKIES